MADCTITPMTEDGNPLAVLQGLIRQRQKVMGEDAVCAVTATAINVLSSLRSSTKVADKKKAAQATVAVAERDDLVAGFYGKGRRCVRRRGQTRGHIEGVHIVNLIGNYQTNENARVFMLQMSRGKATKENSRTAFDRLLVIAKDKGQVSEYGYKVVERRIATYSGMAKWVIGQAQRKIAASCSTGDVTGKAKKVGLENLIVRKFDSGMSGYGIEVVDGLDYAGLALKGGPATLDAAIMKAANKTAGIITHHYKKMGWKGAMPSAPFTEIMRKRK